MQSPTTRSSRLRAPGIEDLLATFPKSAQKRFAKAFGGNDSAGTPEKRIRSPLAPRAVNVVAHEGATPPQAAAPVVAPIETHNVEVSLMEPSQEQGPEDGPHREAKDDRAVTTARGGAIPASSRSSAKHDEYLSRLQRLALAKGALRSADAVRGAVTPHVAVPAPPPKQEQPVMKRPSPRRAKIADDWQLYPIQEGQGESAPSPASGDAHVTSGALPERRSTCVCVCVCVCVYSYIHTFIHSFIHTYIHTHTHTY